MARREKSSRRVFFVRAATVRERFPSGFFSSEPRPYGSGFRGAYDRAVTALEAKGMLDGFAPATSTGIARMYANMPGAACAVQSSGAGPRLDLSCPKVKSDLCLAASDLAQAFTEARNPARAGAFRAEAAQRYGCAM